MLVRDWNRRGVMDGNDAPTTALGYPEGDAHYSAFSLGMSFHDGSLYVWLMPQGWEVSK